MAKVAAIALTGSLGAMAIAVTALAAGIGMIVWGLSQLSRNQQIRAATDEFEALRDAVVAATQPDQVNRLTRELADLYELQVKRGFRLAAEDMDAWVQAVRDGAFATTELVTGLDALTAAQDSARDAAIKHLNAINALKAGASALAGLFPGGMTEAELKAWSPELSVLGGIQRSQRREGGYESDPYRIGRERTTEEGVYINVDGMSLNQILGEKVQSRQQSGG
jgi:hypothetical protein